MKVIVNAYDLGISDMVNDSVFELIEELLVSSATIMANGPYVEDACQRLTRFPQRKRPATMPSTPWKPSTIIRDI